MHDRGRLARLDGTALVARGAEGVAEGHALALRGLVERRLQAVGVDGLRGGVADDVDAAAATARAVARATAGGDSDRERHGGQDGACPAPTRTGASLSHWEL